MTKPIATQGHMHVCPKVSSGPRPHVGGPVVNAGQSFVRYNGIPIAVVSGQCLCTGVPTSDKMSTGSTVVRISGKGVMRIGDGTSHGGKIVSGAPNFRAD